MRVETVLVEHLVDVGKHVGCLCTEGTGRSHQNQASEGYEEPTYRHATSCLAIVKRVAQYSPPLSYRGSLIRASPNPVRYMGPPPGLKITPVIGPGSGAQRAGVNNSIRGVPDLPRRMNSSTTSC